MKLLAVLSTLLLASCIMPPELTWSLEQVTYIDGEPFFETGYYFTQEQCEDAAQGVVASEGTEFTARCEPITYAIGRTLDHFEAVE